MRVALVGTERPSAVKRFRKLSRCSAPAVTRASLTAPSRRPCRRSSSRYARLDDAHAPIGFLIHRHGQNGSCPAPRALFYCYAPTVSYTAHVNYQFSASSRRSFYPPSRCQPRHLLVMVFSLPAMSFWNVVSMWTV